ncbi:MAG: glycerol acyltransferase, partial [Bacteroidales bacterium]|nr:glycerol acyltransferase [Bacteroidales bacterium]
EGYHIWNTNRIAYDILHSSSKFSSNYTSEERKAFEEYCDFKISSFDGDISEIKEIFLSIYSNPLGIVE